MHTYIYVRTHVHMHTHTHSFLFPTWSSQVNILVCNLQIFLHAYANFHTHIQKSSFLFIKRGLALCVIMKANFLPLYAMDILQVKNPTSSSLSEALHWCSMGSCTISHHRPIDRHSVISSPVPPDYSGLHLNCHQGYVGNPSSNFPMWNKQACNPTWSNQA
jgi:hypothetical protein